MTLNIYYNNIYQPTGRYKPITSGQHSASSTSPELRPEVFGRTRAQGIQRRLDALRQCHQQALPDGIRVADGEIIP